MNKIAQISKPVKKVNVQETLLTIPVGESRIIKTRMIKGNSIRSSIRVLNTKGYTFESTEKGLIDEVLVTRRK